MANKFQLRQLPREFGVEVLDVDCSKVLDAETAHSLRILLQEHPIVLFKNQELTPQQLVDFAKNLGDVGTSFNHMHDKIWYKPDAVAEEHKIAKFNNKVAAPLWHTDLGESDYAGLYAKKATGSGNNLWSNGYTAYRLLSDKFKIILDNTYFVYD
ncbi:TauD/TfdA dioxygenase family protein, partial [Parachlamydia acanthamoebae]